MPLPPPRQLEAFLAVAEARSFRIAADRLGISQPALSQNIAQLEASLEAVLFLRTTRSVKLTAEGVELQAQLTKLLPLMHATFDSIRNFGKTEVTELRLGFLASAAAKYLPQALRQFRVRYPDIVLHARDDTARGLFDAVHVGELDLAVSSYLPHRDRNVDFALFLEDPFMAVLPRDHPLAQREKITWKELMKFDFIGANPGSGTRFATDAALQSADIPGKTVMAFNHFLAVSAMIEAGMGVSALPQVNCPPADHPTLCVVPLVDPVSTRNLGVVTQADDGATSGPIHFFRDCVLAAAGNHGG